MESSIAGIKPGSIASKKAPSFTIMDGNEAAVRIAYKTSEVCPIYPIKPSSTIVSGPANEVVLTRKTLLGSTQTSYLPHDTSYLFLATCYPILDFLKLKKIQS